MVTHVFNLVHRSQSTAWLWKKQSWPSSLHWLATQWTPFFTSSPSSSSPSWWRKRTQPCPTGSALICWWRSWSSTTSMTSWQSSKTWHWRLFCRWLSSLRRQEFQPMLPAAPSRRPWRKRFLDTSWNQQWRRQRLCLMTLGSWSTGGGEVWDRYLSTWLAAPRDGPPAGQPWSSPCQTP